MSAMQESYEADLKFMRAHNSLQLEIGSTQFMKTFFRGPSGLYYDAIGDEVFHVTHIGGTDATPIYIIEFCDSRQDGALVDHGFNYFLGVV
jgi:hypothetical protein